MRFRRLCINLNTGGILMLVREYTKEIEGKQITLKIISDEDAISPREFGSNLGHMVCWHGRYRLGDPHSIDPNDFCSWEEIEEYLWKKKGACIVYPIYIYDHSGITISVNHTYPYNDFWDAGQIGYIYCTKADIRKWFNIKRVTEKQIQKAREILLMEVKDYDAFLRGEVYGYVLEKDGEVIDSCFGFYGSDMKENGLLSCLPKEYEFFKEAFVY